MLFQGTSSLYVYKELRLNGIYFHGPGEFRISGFYCIGYIVDAIRTSREFKQHVLKISHVPNQHILNEIRLKI